MGSGRCLPFLLTVTEAVGRMRTDFSHFEKIVWAALLILSSVQGKNNLFRLINIQSSSSSGQDRHPCTTVNAPNDWMASSQWRLITDAGEWNTSQSVTLPSASVLVGGGWWSRNYDFSPRRRKSEIYVYRHIPPNQPTNQPARETTSSSTSFMAHIHQPPIHNANN